jgi:transporter family-2 protein
MHVFLISLVVAVGMLLPVQAGLNAGLRRDLGHPLHATVANFLVGLAALSCLILALRVPAPTLQALGSVPVWKWAGGLIGASLVFTAVIAAPKLGAALLLACLVAGQMTSSVVLDHYGWIGYPVQPLTVWRIVGVLLVAAGVVLIERG